MTWRTTNGRWGRARPAKSPLRIETDKSYRKAIPGRGKREDKRSIDRAAAAVNAALTRREESEFKGGLQRKKKETQTEIEAIQSRSPVSGSRVGGYKLGSKRSCLGRKGM